MKRAEKGYRRSVQVYREDAMTQTVCLICGERVGRCEYRGKPVCSECIRDIRTKF